jgi:hypothetical protein
VAGGRGVTTYLLTMGWVNRRSFDVALLLMPIYLLLISLVIVPLGPITYVRMAWADRKVGVIRRSELSQRTVVDAGLARPL